MSFIDWPLEFEKNCSLASKRRRSAQRLIDAFSSAFPMVNYQLVWYSRLINAQAWRLGGARYVYLYGGLVRTPGMSFAGLALTLAHETGHHMGGLPRDSVMSWMTSEAQADRWAIDVAMPYIFGRRAKMLTRRGAEEIRALQLACGSQHTFNVMLNGLEQRIKRMS